MLPESINQFKTFAPLELPELINPTLLESEEYTDDYAILTYELSPALTIDDVIDRLDQQIELVPCYYKVPSESTDFGHSCCVFSNPEFGHMYVINALTNGTGKCPNIYATIFDSLEIMQEHLTSELRRQSQAGGRFVQRISEKEMLILFM